MKNNEICNIYRGLNFYFSNINNATQTDCNPDKHLYYPKIAINGLGRIGRLILRAIFELELPVDIIAVNGPAAIEQHAHLIQFDSVHGTFRHEVSIEKTSDTEEYLLIAGKKIRLFREKNIDNLHWNDIDIVMECTGAFTSASDAHKHIVQGAKKVIISAPAKEKTVKTIVLGVNQDTLDNTDNIISIGSCTTNCLAPVAKALIETIGIEKGFMTTVHSYTGDQNNVDGSHKDLRRGRACGVSMVPTSTGAAKALGLVLPSLSGKLSGSAIRVPTPNVSLIDLTILSSKNTTANDVNDIFSHYASQALSAGGMHGILATESRSLVSVDFSHSYYSSIVDTQETTVVDGNCVRVLSWYDNEWAFALRMINVAGILHSIK